MNISNFLKESNGNESSMRMLVAFIVAVIMGTWCFVSIKTSALAPLNMETVLALLGSLMAKAWQKGKEETAAVPPSV